MFGLGHILVVEDNADLRCALVMLLESKGHRVIEAADGRLALEALASARMVRLVILDLMMPVMDGPTFLAHKALGPHAAVPVVIFSSSPSAALESWPFVVCTVPKLDGIDGLLGVIRHIDGAAAVAGAMHE
jgi:CheY-like chemotaxis protein